MRTFVPFQAEVRLAHQKIDPTLLAQKTFAIYWQAYKMDHQKEIVKFELNSRSQLILNEENQEAVYSVGPVKVLKGTHTGTRRDGSQEFYTVLFDCLEIVFIAKL